MKVLIWGAGGGGKEALDFCLADNTMDIIGFVDNVKKGEWCGLQIFEPSMLSSLEFDQIYIATIGWREVSQQIRNLGIQSNKIFISPREQTIVLARENFLLHFSQEIYRKNVNGAVAEAGVFRGEFASKINQAFPDRKLYLFDTFEGFDSRDLIVEKKFQKQSAASEYFRETSEQLVLEKMKYPKNCVLKKGYIPETLEECDDSFCFVNLDLDLYKPTSEALKFFYPRLATGGVILVHDYFDNITYPNLKNAVTEFAEESNCRMIPIGDLLSIAIIKGNMKNVCN